MAVAGVSSAAAAESPGQAESAFVSRINGERSAAGRAPLSSRGDLAWVARNHAQRMVDRNDLFHNPNLGGEVSGWQVVAENVGMGSSVSQIHSALMGSSTHRGNILSSEVTEVGVGVVGAPDGSLWVVQVFRLPVGAAQPAPAPVAAAPAPAPAPAPRPAPVPAPAARPAAAPATPPSTPPTTVAPAPTTTVPPTTIPLVADPVEERRVAAASYARLALLQSAPELVAEPVSTTDPVSLSLWLAALVAASGCLGAVGARRLVVA